MMMFWSEIIDGEVVVLKVLFVGFHLVCQQSLQLFHLGQQVDQLCLPLPFLLHLQVLLLHLLRYLLKKKLFLWVLINLIPSSTQEDLIFILLNIFLVGLLLLLTL